MTDLETIALDALERATRHVERQHRPNLLRALMRLSGNALAAIRGNEEAGAEHTRLGHQHFTKGPGR